MAEKTYQQLQSELSDILTELQSGDATVDTAMDLFKQGHKVIAQLEKRLKQAENEIKKLND